jgi:hypothetical protein
MVAMSRTVIRNKSGRKPELGKKAAEVLALRLPDETKTAVKAYARREAITLTAAIRRFIQEGLAKAER